MFAELEADPQINEIERARGMAFYLTLSLF